MKLAYCLPFLLVAAACGQSGAEYEPILDGAPSAAFQVDLTACQSLARDQKQFDSETVQAAVLGAGIGAVLGEVDSSDDPWGGAVVGALVGGASGVADADERREEIVVECMRGRGHRVVG
ncbi:glycine zipper family protein [Epibacterium sp. SM1979]|uniref:Glycine zipper family protein n=1 Tax=Tritonibacter litoralis TaxID=2662264 RepID=A0A843YKV2_9RHOB|nr:YMGG-like glycine zipper-containing protein [Tritonibacter litoralis]MQQ09799.1 glycine zipper family protein [Tritonibacter litoralis]